MVTRPQSLSRPFGILGIFALAASAAGAAHAGVAPALSKASLTYTWTNIRCGVTTPDGTTTYSDCSTPSFDALVLPGSSVFVTATLNYTYSDDGLPLAQPQGFLIDTLGHVRYVDHEAGAIYLNSSQCRDARVCLPTDVTQAFNGPDYIILGDNATPDQLSGSLTYTATTTVRSTWPTAVDARAFIAVGATPTYSGITPAVPEPATYALLLAGLAGMGWVAARRGRGMAAGRR